MKRRIIFTALVLLVAAGALAFRLPRLDRRPMHADEAVQAEIFRRLWQEGHYRYNPNEFHGPTLPYATLPVVWIGGEQTFAETTETTFRMVPVLFGVGMILLVWLLGDALGRPAAVAAAALLAISPAMVFYSRYYIHETLFVFFTLAAIGTGWRYARSGKLGWCLAAGACLGLMQATKETNVPPVYLAAGLALALAWGWRLVIRDETEPERPRLRAWHLAAGVAVAAVVAVTLLSSFFTNLRGPVDGVLAYLPWLRRAGGDSPHVHPWYFYLHRLGYWRVGDGPVWSEGLILALAAIGFLVALLPKGRLLRGASGPFVRWLAFYTLLLTAAYSAIPYKTPWLVLGPLQGMILLAGVGAVALVRLVPTLPLKGLAMLLLLGAAGELGRQAYRASFVMPADIKNPYVYAQTSDGLFKLADLMDQLGQAAPEGYGATVKVIWEDRYFWPLPWYLRRFEHVELWTNLPADPVAALVIASPKYDAALTEKLQETHVMTGFHELRPQVLAMLWVRKDIWEAHVRRLGRIP